eukprot:scaffold17804_cov126-Isochrysis_galbana.AAC.2
MPVEAGVDIWGEDREGPRTLTDDEDGNGNRLKCVLRAGRATGGLGAYGCAGGRKFSPAPAHICPRAMHTSHSDLIQPRSGRPSMRRLFRGSSVVFRSVRREMSCDSGTTHSSSMGSTSASGGEHGRRCAATQSPALGSGAGSRTSEGNRAAQSPSQLRVHEARDADFRARDAETWRKIQETAHALRLAQCKPSSAIPARRHLAGHEAKVQAQQKVAHFPRQLTSEAR